MNNTTAVLKKLVGDRIAAVAAKKAADTAVKAADTEIVQIIDVPAKLAEKERAYGEVSFEQDGIAFTAGTEKEVKWDSDMLMEIAQTIPWQLVKTMFKIKFEMSETAYKALVTNVQNGLQSQDLLDKVNAARTTKISEVKIKKAEYVKE